MRDYSSMTTLIVTKLQSAGTMDYSVAEVDYGIEEGLKEFATYKPHIVSIPFKIESRFGTDVTGAASTLTDSVKSQFLDADATDEKVVHNITDNTWAVVKTYASASTLTLNASIMNANDAYEIYNKRCWNKRQIYIGDILPEILDIDSVEYPIGNKRNWEIPSEGILEIDVDYIPDSNANTAIVQKLPNVDVLVRVCRPHVLNSKTDISGLVAGTSGAAGATTLSCSGLTASATVEAGGEFLIQDLKQSYIITATTTASTAGIATISFYPPLEAVAASASVLTFTSSTLKPNEEEIFAELVASRLAINKAPKFFNAISLGGGEVWKNFLDWSERRLGETLGKLRRQTPPKFKKVLPKD